MAAMDDAVLRAINKWPNVPAVYGWLTLNRRGSWLLKTVSGRFEPIVHSGMVDFIGRNYERDGDGHWYFQNGPQKVYVSLEYTPWIYRLDDSGQRLVSQSNEIPSRLCAIFLDDGGSLLVETDLGIGLLLDRDLPTFIDRLDTTGTNVEALFEDVMAGTNRACTLFGQTVSLMFIPAAEVPNRFRFVPRPTPPAGQPDC